MGLPEIPILPQLGGAGKKQRPFLTFGLNSDQNGGITATRDGGAEMTADTPREFERIHWLFHEFRDAINRGGVGRRTALDAVEYTLEDLLVDMYDSEEKLKEYFETLRDRAIQTWRRQRAAA